jgi:hypothetical protein
MLITWEVAGGFPEANWMNKMLPPVKSIPMGNPQINKANSPGTITSIDIAK